MQPALVGPVCFKTPLQVHRLELRPGYNRVVAPLE
jgi:hypothetical protein